MFGTLIRSEVVESEPVNLRDRARLAVRSELAAVASDLFAKQGYEHTTVEQIAAAAGMSRSSFFRYFSTKEDVLLRTVDDHGKRIAAALAERPADEPAWPALRRAFDGLLASIEEQGEPARVLSRLMLESPALHAAHLRKRTTWTAAIAAVLEDRLADAAPAERPLRAVALAGAALACLEAAQRAWVDEGPEGASLPALLDQTMGAVGDLAG